jgi:hypothetical protein
MLDKLAREDFEPLVGGTMQLVCGEVLVSVEVVEARALASPSPRATPPFALLLRAPMDFRGGQGMYRLEHPKHGPIDLFLVPVGPDAKGMCFEAVFN